MSAIAFDPLIAEAKRRARKRYVLALAIALLAAGAVTVYTVARESRPASVSIPAGATGAACGVRGVGARILSPGGATLFREPGDYAHPNRGFPDIRCSGSAIWALWFNGVGAGNEAYLGARSVDGGRTWRPAFSNPYFGVKAPHWLGPYLGVWTLRGSRDAYFVGSCPACGGATNALYVTRDAGGTFRRYDIPALSGYTVTRIAVRGAEVTLWARRFVRGVEPARKTVTVPVA